MVSLASRRSVKDNFLYQLNLNQNLNKITNIYHYLHALDFGFGILGQVCDFLAKEFVYFSHPFIEAAEVIFNFFRDWQSLKEEL